MKSVSDRYRNVASTFSARVREVAPDAWERPSPCEGWVTRDVVRHLVEWVPGFFAGTAGLDLGQIPSVDEDPVAAWISLDAALQAALDDPAVASREFDFQGRPQRIDEAIGTIVLGDVVVHTWDIARAAGLDETLDPDEVHAMLSGMVEMEEPMRQSGHFGPRVEVPADADEQTRLIAFTGRRP